MDTTFKNLISEHDFDKQLGRYFSRLAFSDVDYLCSYSPASDNPCLRVDFDNCKQLSRITLWESGECDIEVMSLADSSHVINEVCELKTVGEFEDKLLGLIEYMKRTQALH